MIKKEDKISIVLRRNYFYSTFVDSINTKCAIAID